jgi:hypothetical protein
VPVNTASVRDADALGFRGSLVVSSVLKAADLGGLWPDLMLRLELSINQILVRRSKTSAAPAILSNPRPIVVEPGGCPEFVRPV